MSKKLKPCPSCNENIEVYTCRWESGLKWYVECQMCETSSGSYSTKAKAIKAWNTRIDDGLVKKLVEALESKSYDLHLPGRGKRKTTYCCSICGCKPHSVNCNYGQALIEYKKMIEE